MKLYWAVLLAFLPMLHAAAFNYTNFDSSVSLGGTYNLEAYSNGSINTSIQCANTWKDQFNNTVHTFTADPDHNSIRLTPDGYVKSFVHIDDAFFVGQSYNMTLNCGNYTAMRSVFIDTPGDLEINRITSNITKYYYNHPFDAIVATVLSFFGIAAVAGVFKWGRDRS